jgi:thioredoxin 1
MVYVLEVNADNWDNEVLKSDIVTIVDFWHDRCPWCIKLEPIYNEVAEEYEGKIKFVKINVLENDDNKQIAISNGVMGTPTLVFFCDGRHVDEAVGFMTKRRLKTRIEEVLVKHKECINQSSKFE